MKRIYTTIAEAQQVKDNNSGLFARLLSPQPREDFAEFGDINKYASHGSAWFYDGQVGIPLHYPSGDYVMYAPTQVKVGLEVTGEYDKIITIPTKTDTKLSVATTVKCVQDLTPKEVRNLLDIRPPQTSDMTHRDWNRWYQNKFYEQLCNYWNANHTKPSKTADGLGYECFPYDDSYYKILEQNKRCELLGNWYYWKGLPLTIYANPMLEFNAWTKGVME